MRQYDGELIEVWHEAGSDGPLLAGRIACPDTARPGPGQYLLATRSTAPAEPLAAAVFAGDDFSGEAGSFVCAPPIPAAWTPGDRLSLIGPYGRGFRLPPGARRVALADLDETPSRLMGLVSQALHQGAAVTLFQSGKPDQLAELHLPISVEVYPLDAFSDALAWADYLAFDLPLRLLPAARAMLHINRDTRLPDPAQALIYTPMPCFGLAECGVCAVKSRSAGWLLACKDGPVFDLNALEW